MEIILRKVIVTGATGFIGKSLIKYLITKRIQVYAIVRNPSLLESYSSSYLTVYQSQLDKLSALKIHFDADIDVFYHLAWEGSSGIDRSNYKLQLNNVKNSIICLEFAKSLGCKKFVSTGTITENLVEQLELVDRDSDNIFYGLAKFTSFKMLLLMSKKHGISLVWAQLSNVYGEDDKTGNIISYVISNLKNNKIAEVSLAESYYDFVHIDDVAIALTLLGEKFTSRNKYYIGSGYPRLLKEFLIDIGIIMNKTNLIGLGKRTGDGIFFDLSMFNIEELQNDTNFSTLRTFQENIRKLVNKP
jgi:nucleoside-diphosphate-sugar epimerase